MSVLRANIASFGVAMLWSCAAAIKLVPTTAEAMAAAVATAKAIFFIWVFLFLG